MQSVAHTYALWESTAAKAACTVPLTAVVTTLDEPRIGRFAGSAFDTLGSTSQGVRAAKQKRLLLNGVVSPPTARVRYGDEVTLEAPISSAPSGIDDSRIITLAEGLLKTGVLGIAYEDEVLAIVEKPAGIHTTPFGAPLSFEHVLPAILTPPPLESHLDVLRRPTAVHRLDARVSGLVVCAKTRSSAAALAAAFRERRVHKRYRALCLGKLDEGALAKCATLASDDELPSFYRGRYDAMGPHSQVDCACACACACA